MKVNIPEFKTKDELYSYLRQNKSMFLEAKKNEVKYADAISFAFVELSEENKTATKALNQTFDIADVSNFKVKVVINTTNIMDSHSDVHLKGIWTKSLQEKKQLYLLQEHVMKFENIISDEIKATATSMKWTDLGQPYTGDTQALIFNANIEKDRNSYMAEQYAKGRVKNHSVGMRYMKLYLCMNSDSKWDVEEKANWDKYLDKVVNKEVAEAQGYFWAVTEAKVIEGSAVVMGSNQVTPTIQIGKQEPLENTQLNNEPPQGTQKSISEMIKETKILN